MLTFEWKKELSVGFQYVPADFFSYLMSHLCCMATTFPTDGKSVMYFKKTDPFRIIHWQAPTHFFDLCYEPRMEVMSVININVVNNANRKLYIS